MPRNESFQTQPETPSIDRTMMASLPELDPRENPQMENARKYWRGIIQRIKDENVDAVAVESLSGNGFTTSAQTLLGADTVITAEHETAWLIKSFSEAADGKLVVIDESDLLTKISLEQLTSIIEIIKKKHLKLVLHVRLDPNSHRIVALLNQQGVHCATNTFEFASRAEDMTKIAEDLLVQAFKGVWHPEQDLVRRVASLCVVPGDIPLLVNYLQSHAGDSQESIMGYMAQFRNARGRIDEEKLASLYGKVISPYRENRSVGKLGEPLFNLLTQRAGEDSFLKNELSPQEQALAEKANRFNLVTYMELVKGEAYQVKDKESYLRKTA